MKSQKGFTLIEVIVVIAVVAILAAILTPIIAKNIDDAKKGRALNECQVIAAAINSFYKDVGRWPTSNQASPLRNYLYVLATANGNGATGSAWNSWFTGGTRGDTFENQLNYNDIMGSGSGYPTTGEFAWRGPYSIAFKPDPWGSRYYCNVIGLWYGGTTYDVCLVISPGPNGTFQTLVTDDEADPASDDIGFSLN